MCVRYCMDTKTSGTGPRKMRIVRTSIPETWSVALDHLALDLGLSKQAVLADGALLVLRYHERARDLGELASPSFAALKERKR